MRGDTLASRATRAALAGSLRPHALRPPGRPAAAPGCPFSITPDNASSMESQRGVAADLALRSAPPWLGGLPWLGGGWAGLASDRNR